jgi:hypothetical protein
MDPYRLGNAGEGGELRCTWREGEGAIKALLHKSAMVITQARVLKRGWRFTV